MDIAIVHDHLMQRGGAERVFLSMVKAFPSARLYTSMYAPDLTYPEVRDLDIHTLFVDKLPLIHRNFRAALPFLPIAFSGLRLHSEVALLSSAGWSHGAQADGKKVVYWYSPAKWLYQTDQYFGGRRSFRRGAAAALTGYLKAWDQRVAKKPARHLTLSTAVRDRLRDVYGLDAEVLPAPHTIDPDAPKEPVEGIEGGGFFLCISRLVAQKNVDVVVEAFRKRSDEMLVVVGRGPEDERLRAMAPPNVVFTGPVTDAQIRWLYDNCKAILSASYEDYGLTPLEGAVFGKPSIALRWGGFLDTIVEDETGVLFGRAVPDDLVDAMDRLGRLNIDPARLQQHARRYSEERFIERLTEVVEEERRA